jgi:hypothetical protein
MADKIVGVELEAELRQIKSMADGTYNIVINVPEYCLEQIKVMLGWLNNLVDIVIAEKEKLG